MDGLKLARIRRCRACGEWRAAPTWRWPHCVAAKPEAEIDNAFTGGPESNCPRGTWQGLTPVDLAAEAAARSAARLARERALLGPVIAALVDGLDDEERIRRLGIAVVARLISPDLADAILARDIAPAQLGGKR